MGGSNAVVSGSGTASNPYVIDVVGSDVAGSIAVADTPSVDMTMTGTGSTADPYTISAVATLSMEELSDVDDTPAAGEVPVFDGTSWTFAAPPTTPPGAVNVGDGITGDGSAGDPIEAHTSGTFGTAPLDVYGSDPTIGQVVYTDSTGALRVQPDGADYVAAGGTRPNQYPGRIIVAEPNDRLLISDGTNYLDPVTRTCTSTTRPTSPWTGMTVFETDSGRQLVFDGTTWRVVYEDSSTDALPLLSTAGVSSGWTVTSGTLWRRNGMVGLQIRVQRTTDFPNVLSRGDIVNQTIRTVTDPYWRPAEATSLGVTTTGPMGGFNWISSGSVIWAQADGLGVTYDITSGTAWTLAGTGPANLDTIDPAAGW